jgi:hypothetical protein
LNKFKSIDELDDYLQIQLEKLFHHYDMILHQTSKSVNEKIKLFTDISSKLNFVDFKQLEKESLEQQKSNEKKRIEVSDKKEQIEKLAKSIEDKIITLKKGDLINAFNLKTYLSENLKHYRTLKKDTQEVKAEFNKILNQDRSPLIKEKLSKSLIQNELQKKTTIFDRNLINLRKKYSKAVDLVSSIEKKISEK